MLFHHTIVLQFVFVYFSSTFAHLCLWKPMQRGDFSLDPPGSHDCYRKLSPCGGFNSSTSKSRLSIKSGSLYRVEFQQHLNHYYPLNPGQLDISFAIGLDPPEEDFSILKSFNDYNPMNHNTQTNFSIEIQLPNIECEHCVLRVRYLTNNPDEEDHGKIFYQCSDIQLRNKSSNYIQIKDQKGVIKHENDPHDCCSPSSFQMSFIHWIPEIFYTSSGMIYYDKLQSQMRISMSSMGIEYNMWMDFTSGKQYLNNVNEKSCRLFGLDSWNDWCYGNTYNQSEDFLASDVSCLNGVFDYCSRWKNGDFIFESTANECFPSSLTRLSTEEKTIYFNHKSGPISPEVFRPDPICLKQPMEIH